MADDKEPTRHPDCSGTWGKRDGLVINVSADMRVVWVNGEKCKGEPTASGLKVQWPWPGCPPSVLVRVNDSILIEHDQPAFYKLRSPKVAVEGYVNEGHLSPENKEFFRKKGFIVVKKGANQILLREAQALVAQHKEKPGAHSRSWTSSEACVVNLVRESDRVTDILQELLEKGYQMTFESSNAQITSVYGLHDSHTEAIFANPCRNPNGGEHLDGMHTNYNGCKRGQITNFTCLVGVALDDTTAEGPMHGNLCVYEGSHLAVAQALRAYEGGVDAWARLDEIEELTPTDRMHRLFEDTGTPWKQFEKEYPVTPLCLSAGDTVIMHHGVLHGVAPNCCPYTRSMTYTRYYAPRPEGKRDCFYEAMLNPVLEFSYL